ncbi:MAG TPA: M48 family metallopeptidase [Acidobacteriaceae bacterium]|nr:M48 family metallopeptidase [Acidobacteriaceae bacterium]
MADQLEPYFKPVQDPGENLYLDRITKRLLAVLPPTKIQFRVILVESSEVNGFSLAGGRVYLTRKLVASAQTEDEAAGVIAHEMGHILSHQIVDETAADMRRLLGMTSVGDKADIYARFQQLMDARMKDKHPEARANSDEKQEEADLVAVYAMAAAGYRPQAYSEFWDRVNFVRGKTGNAVTDFFGITTPDSRRLRAIQKLVTALPLGCGGSGSNDSSDFEKWHSLVVANQASTVGSDFKPLLESTLTPPLRMDLEWLRFSRDGKYILAQDEGSIFVLSRDPYQPLFRFDAEDALEPEFTPDSQRVVFHTRGLHTEEWSITDRKLVASHEPLSQRGCIQTKLAPDGRTLFCISFRGDMDGTLTLTALDTTSGSVLYEKKDFFTPTGEYLLRLLVSAQSSIPTDVMPGGFSADGNYLLIGPGNDKVAFDLRTRSTVSIGWELKQQIVGAYAFIGDDKVVGEALNARDSGVFSFPQGKRVAAAPFRLEDLEPVTQGEYVLSHDIKDYAIGLADVAQAKFIAGSKTSSMDVWSGLLANEGIDGSVTLRKIADSTGKPESTTLPLSPLAGSLRTALSTDGRLLALSTRTRGGVWDVSSGRLLTLFRGFDSAMFAPDNSLVAQFPKYGKNDRGIVHITFAPLASTLMPYKEDDDTSLTFGMLEQWKHPDKKHTEWTVRKLEDNSVMWSKTYEGEGPGHTYNLVPGQTILSFLLTSDAAKARLKEMPELTTQAAAVKDKNMGRLIQVIDNTNGKVLHEFILTVPLTYTGVGGINIVGQNLYLSSGDNRTMTYSLENRTQLRQLFGYVAAVDAASNRICTVNRRDEAIVYDAEGRQLATYHTGSPLRLAHFEQDGKRLLLLTADQKIQIVEIAPTVTN